jgi:hypothetical protein
MDPDTPTFPRIVRVGIDDFQGIVSRNIPTCKIRLTSPSFELGRSTVSAVAEAPYESKHQHVIRLTILRGIWQRRLVEFLSKPPISFQTFIKGIWPGWFLPKTVVLKKLKQNWDDEFDT